MENIVIDIKTLQYLMDYSNAGATLKVYTQISYNRAAEQLCKIMDFLRTSDRVADKNQVDLLHQFMKIFVEQVARTEKSQISETIATQRFQRPR